MQSESAPARCHAAPRAARPQRGDGDVTLRDCTGDEFWSIVCDRAERSPSGQKLSESEALYRLPVSDNGMLPPVEDPTGEVIA